MSKTKTPEFVKSGYNILLQTSDLGLIEVRVLYDKWLDADNFVLLEELTIDKILGWPHTHRMNKDEYGSTWKAFEILGQTPTKPSVTPFPMPII